MKKIILAASILLMTLTGMSQSKEFAGAMGEALSQYATCKTVDDFQMLGNRFSLIADAEKTEWLPFYYHAYCYILMSFIEQSDAVKRDSYLDVAEKSINKIIALVPNEAEAFVLQSFYFTGRLVINPMERGQQYSMLAGQAVGKALSIEPNNPRAKVIKLQNDMGSAQFFGKDPKEYCPQALELLANWDNYKLKSPLYPAWGKDQVTEIVAGCK
ncbi:MAG: hypothetical protein EPN88_11075 [Bacteroidetes bacterium]|nr:MAG: hypothetical protein EPN88_11075 [Bacteroidota bacterium]